MRHESVQGVSASMLLTRNETEKKGIKSILEKNLCLVSIFRECRKINPLFIYFLLKKTTLSRSKLLYNKCCSVNIVYFACSKKMSALF